MANDAVFSPDRKWLASRLLASEPRVRHGVTTRRMMESRDDRAILVRRLQRALDWGDEPICLAEQVHGGEVKIIGAGDLAAMNGREWVWHPGVDALATNLPNATLAIFTADCLPILFADGGRGVIGVVHAGWRGTLARVLAHALEAAFTLGARPGRVKLWIGPCISGEAYEVSAELAARFAREFPACAAEAVHGRRVDLAAVNRAEALASGLREDNVSRSGLCTRAWPEDLCSYRVSGADAGRMASAISLQGVGP
ncbi:MAG: polyphenol oxidase family protein [Candidatus Sumerlaeota bacterium]|nr:polyphenol oxidase family protein [Candidatus Sumerlaeota bacterium]